jgi:dihydroneopterin aldolase
MSSKIEIIGIETQSRLGVSLKERKKPQKIIIDLILTLDLTQAGRHDNLKLSANYFKIERLARALAEKGERLLIERLAWEIALHILDEEPLVDAISVRIHKKPELMPKTREVIVEMTKTRLRRKKTR